MFGRDPNTVLGPLYVRRNISTHFASSLAALRRQPSGRFLVLSLLVFSVSQRGMDDPLQAIISLAGSYPQQTLREARQQGVQEESKVYFCFLGPCHWWFLWQ